MGEGGKSRQSGGWVLLPHACPTKFSVLDEDPHLLFTDSMQADCGRVHFFFFVKLELEYCPGFIFPEEKRFKKCSALNAPLFCTSGLSGNTFPFGFCACN